MRANSVKMYELIMHKRPKVSLVGLKIGRDLVLSPAKIRLVESVTYVSPVLMNKSNVLWV